MHSLLCERDFNEEQEHSGRPGQTRTADLTHSLLESGVRSNQLSYRPLFANRCLTWAICVNRGKFL